MSEDEPGSIFERKVEVYTNGSYTGALVSVDGEVLPLQRRVVVDSGMDETTIEIELIHRPTRGTIHISGYLITEDQWKAFKTLREENRRLSAQLRGPEIVDGEGP